MQITMIAAGILGLLLLVPGVRIAMLRMRTRISPGTGDNPDMETLVRAHGNAAEWIPVRLSLTGGPDRACAKDRAGGKAAP